MRSAAFGIFLALAACQLVTGGDSDRQHSVADVNPITGGEISVAALDDDLPPSGHAAETPPLLGAAADEEGAPPVGPAVDAPAPQAAAVVVKSAQHLACEARGGRWSSAGSTAASFCQTVTRDAGKSCRAASDCTGYCLAKSRSCAPVTPMFGCHEILNDSGRMLTECIN